MDVSFWNHFSEIYFFCELDFKSNLIIRLQIDLDLYIQVGLERAREVMASVRCMVAARVEVVAMASVRLLFALSFP